MIYVLRTKVVVYRGLEKEVECEIVGYIIDPMCGYIWASRKMGGLASFSPLLHSVQPLPNIFFCLLILSTFLFKLLTLILPITKENRRRKLDGRLTSPSPNLDLNCTQAYNSSTKGISW